MSIETAELVARLAHGDQKYPGPNSPDRPYMFHLQMVADILAHYNYPNILMESGWLHDVLEDTSVTYEDLSNAFGFGVADIVEACTGRGANRKERQADIHCKLLDNSPARIVKLADRMANVFTCLLDGNDHLFKMYLREDMVFRQTVSRGIRFQMLEDYHTLVNTKSPFAWLQPQPEFEVTT